MQSYAMSGRMVLPAAEFFFIHLQKKVGTER